MQCGVFTRRALLLSSTGAVVAAAANAALPGAVQGTDLPAGGRAVTKGRIRQTAVSWCYEPMDVETLARHAAAIGLVALENIPPKDWPILRRYGLVNAMTVAHGFVDGLNHRENHAMCIAKLTEALDASGEAGFPNVITFSGMRRGMPDDVGLDNTVHGLKQVIGLAERKKGNLCLEVLNSRVNVTMKGHPDNMCGKVEWAVEICKRLSSERMKILFEIYHVQIMQGDVISRIRQYHSYIGHYHLAGVPGRNEMDDTQELNYPPILRAILDTGYQGYVGQEFIPTHDPIPSLRESARMCDV
ncbi:MAG: hydroxypyruvate isomerase family protein [Thermoguttaceae bacterium]